MHSIEWQLALTPIGQFACLHGFYFSPGKSVAMHFCHWEVFIQGQTLDGHPLPVVEASQFLGLCLTWVAYI